MTKRLFAIAAFLLYPIVAYGVEILVDSGGRRRTFLGEGRTHSDAERDAERQIARWKARESAA